MKDAIGYVRVSSEEQADSGLGLEARRQRIAAYCAMKRLHLAEVFEYPGISAVKRFRGERISGHAPYGWDFGGNGLLVENAREQKIIARMRRMQAEGKSYRGIAVRLDEEGIRPKRGRAAQRPAGRGSSRGGARGQSDGVGASRRSRAGSNCGQLRLQMGHVVRQLANILRSVIAARNDHHRGKAAHQAGHFRQDLVWLGSSMSGHFSPGRRFSRMVTAVLTDGDRGKGIGPLAARQSDPGNPRAGTIVRSLPGQRFGQKTRWPAVRWPMKPLEHYKWGFRLG